MRTAKMFTSQKWPRLESPSYIFLLPPRSASLSCCFISPEPPPGWSDLRLLMDLLEYKAEHVKDGIAVNYFIQKAWELREFISSKNLLELLQRPSYFKRVLWAPATATWENLEMCHWPELHLTGIYSSCWLLIFQKFLFHHKIYSFTPSGAVTSMD